MTKSQAKTKAYVPVKIENQMSTKPHNQLTDPELYALCKKWGTEALEARRKFIGLLPEVYQRRLYERRNFQSIYHFAAQLGGVSKPLVDEVLRLEKRFQVLPVLHAALIEGEIGLSKLARIASVAAVENEAELCEKVRILSRRAVDVWVKDLQDQNLNKTQQQATGFDQLNEVHPDQNHDLQILNNLSPELKNKLKELIDKGIDINQILLTALAKRETEITQQKIAIGPTPAKSRHIPTQIKTLIQAEYGSRCSVKNCQNLASQIHHEKHFATYRDHDPRYLKPLCYGHHELEHAHAHVRH